MAPVATDHLCRNLAALAERQPAVAALIEAEPSPRGAVPATGRDGTNTFQLSSKHGRLAWLGGSSMPSISATAMFAHGEGGGGNLALPGILTGYEPLVLLQKLQAHETLFVLEEHPLHLKLAMQLYDYVEPITAGRLVFIPAADLDESFARFFQDHPGYLLPVRLSTVPQRSPAQASELQRRLEAAGAVAALVQSRVVDSYAKRLHARKLEPWPESPRVAVLGVDARPSSLEQAERISRALDQLQWPHEVCVPDAPQRCHVAARIAAVDRVGADFVLLINGFSGSSESLFPKDLSLASWFLPGSSIESATGNELHDRRLVFTSTKAMMEEADRAGAWRDRIEICDIAADDAIYRHLPNAVEDAASRIETAVLMDLPETNPEAVGVTMASHVVLWRAMEQAVSRSVDRYRPQIAGSLLNAAQRVSGTKLEDATVREQFLAVLRERLAPTALARAAAEALVGSTARVALYGLNWPAVQMAGEDVRRGVIPAGADLNELFNMADTVVLPEISDIAVQTALDALAAGTRAILRSDAESFQQAYPGLADLIPHLSFYATRRELVTTVQQLRSTRKQWAEKRRGLRDLIANRHTVARRLEAIADRLRAHRTNDARVRPESGGAVSRRSR